MATAFDRDVDISERVCVIREEAGGDPNKCPTCTRAPGAPYRRSDRTGQIVEGCIDPIHTASMIARQSANTGRWHFRLEAMKMRREEYDRLAALIKPARRARS